MFIYGNEDLARYFGAPGMQGLGGWGIPNPISAVKSVVSKPIAAAGNLVKTAVTSTVNTAVQPQNAFKNLGKTVSATLNVPKAVAGTALTTASKPFGMTSNILSAVSKAVPGASLATAPARGFLGVTKNVLQNAGKMVSPSTGGGPVKGIVSKMFAPAQTVQEAAADVAVTQAPAVTPAAPAAYTPPPVSYATVPAGGSMGPPPGYPGEAGPYGGDVGMTSSALTAEQPAGMSLPVKLAIGAGVALVAFLGYRAFSRRGGGRRKS